jgi:hypothetical protein
LVGLDVKEFYEMFEKSMKAMIELEKLYESKDLVKMLKKIPELLDFTNQFKRIEYLSALQNKDEHENFIYAIYEPIMKLAATSSRPFTGFSQQNYDSLTRLKWRWLGSRLGDGIAEEAKSEFQP